MALTGLQIQKLLPKTNCKECGSNTCLAFAMKLAAKKTELSECPYASDEAKAVLGAAAEPPVKSVALGPKRGLKLGEETVLYRHEKTFVNQTALAINICDTDQPEAIEATLKAVRDYRLERVGEVISIDMVAVTQKGDDDSAFVKAAVRAWETTGKPLILRSDNPKAMAEAANAVKGSHSVLASATSESVEMLSQSAKENEHALAITSSDLNELSALASDLKKAGFNDLVLEFQTHSLAERFQTNSIARRAALQSNFKPLGYPSIKFLDPAEDLDVVSQASNEILKYGGIVVLPAFDPALVSVLMTLRMNIYTDPQKPIQVEPNLYPVGEPTKESPVFVTTNFSLTYFIVSGEIENSGLSAWLVVPECEGMSVLTSWAAGKFSGATIGKFCKEIDIDTQVSSRKIVIPGYISQVSGELEEAMPGWEVIVGPQEAADIESFVKTRLI
ncbi:MAG: acetyl-CoA decarbonylase/synthase complex subunit gamma [Proteobacteria bacterium]|nr:acetyl-CoA decarbonylase/synthase complex subunit gamma [Pseudomonadota bacterium]